MTSLSVIKELKFRLQKGKQEPSAQITDHTSSRLQPNKYAPGGKNKSVSEKQSTSVTSMSASTARTKWNAQETKLPKTNQSRGFAQSYSAASTNLITQEADVSDNHSVLAREHSKSLPKSQITRLQPPRNPPPLLNNSSQVVADKTNVALSSTSGQVLNLKRGNGHEHSSSPPPNSSLNEDAATALKSKKKMLGFRRHKLTAANKTSSEPKDLGKTLSEDLTTDIPSPDSPPISGPNMGYQNINDFEYKSSPNSVPQDKQEENSDSSSTSSPSSSLKKSIRKPKPLPRRKSIVKMRTLSTSSTSGNSSDHERDSGIDTPSISPLVRTPEYIPEEDTKNHKLPCLSSHTTPENSIATTPAADDDVLVAAASREHIKRTKSDPAPSSISPINTAMLDMDNEIDLLQHIANMPPPIHVHVQHPVLDTSIVTAAEQDEEISVCVPSQEGRNTSQNGQVVKKQALVKTVSHNPAYGCVIRRRNSPKQRELRHGVCSDGEDYIQMNPADSIYGEQLLQGSKVTNKVTLATPGALSVPFDSKRASGYHYLKIIAGDSRLNVNPPNGSNLNKSPEFAKFKGSPIPKCHDDVYVDVDIPDNDEGTPVIVLDNVCQFLPTHLMQGTKKASSDVRTTSSDVHKTSSPAPKKKIPMMPPTLNNEAKKSKGKVRKFQYTDVVMLNPAGKERKLSKPKKYKYELVKFEDNSKIHAESTLESEPGLVKDEDKERASKESPSETGTEIFVDKKNSNDVDLSNPLHHQSSDSDRELPLPDTEPQIKQAYYIKHEDLPALTSAPISLRSFFNPQTGRVVWHEYVEIDDEVINRMAEKGSDLPSSLPESISKLFNLDKKTRKVNDASISSSNNDGASGTLAPDDTSLMRSNSESSESPYITDLNAPPRVPSRPDNLEDFVKHLRIRSSGDYSYAAVPGQNLFGKFHVGKDHSLGLLQFCPTERSQPICRDIPQSSGDKLSSACPPIPPKSDSLLREQHINVSPYLEPLPSKKKKSGLLIRSEMPQASSSTVPNKKSRSVSPTKGLKQRNRIPPQKPKPYKVSLEEKRLQREQILRGVDSSPVGGDKSRGDQAVSENQDAVIEGRIKKARETRARQVAIMKSKGHKLSRQRSLSDGDLRRSSGKKSDVEHTKSPSDSVSTNHSLMAESEKVKRLKPRGPRAELKSKINRQSLAIIMQNREAIAEQLNLTSDSDPSQSMGRDNNAVGSGNDDMEPGQGGTEKKTLIRGLGEILLEIDTLIRNNLCTEDDLITAIETRLNLNLKSRSENNSSDKKETVLESSNKEHEDQRQQSSDLNSDHQPIEITDTDVQEVVSFVNDNRVMSPENGTENEKQNQQGEEEPDFAPQTQHWNVPGTPPYVNTKSWIDARENWNETETTSDPGTPVQIPQSNKPRSGTVIFQLSSSEEEKDYDFSPVMSLPVSMTSSVMPQAINSKLNQDVDVPRLRRQSSPIYPVASDSSKSEVSKHERTQSSPDQTITSVISSEKPVTSESNFPLQNKLAGTSRESNSPGSSKRRLTITPSPALPKKDSSAGSHTTEMTSPTGDIEERTGAKRRDYVLHKNQKSFEFVVDDSAENSSSYKLALEMEDNRFSKSCEVKALHRTNLLAESVSFNPSTHGSAAAYNQDQATGLRNSRSRSVGNRALQRTNAKRRTTQTNLGVAAATCSTCFGNGTGVFTHKGGKLTDSGSGVTIEIPEHAIPRGKSQRIWFEVVQTVYDPSNREDVAQSLTDSGSSKEIECHLQEKKDRRVQLSPMVLVGPCDAMLMRPIKIKLPHCLPYRNNSWHFQMCARAQNSENEDWTEISNTMGLVELPAKKRNKTKFYKNSSYQMHLDYVQVKTSQLGSFKLIGRPIRNGTRSAKKMLASIFAKTERDNKPLQIEVFVTNAILDQLQAVDRSLTSNGYRCLERNVPVLCFGDGKDMEITLCNDSQCSIPFGTKSIPFGQFWRQTKVGQSHVRFEVDTDRMLDSERTLTLKIQQAGAKIVHETNFLVL